MLAVKWWIESVCLFVGLRGKKEKEFHCMINREDNMTYNNTKYDLTNRAFRQ